jgi:selenium metabolism protein YedF
VTRPEPKTNESEIRTMKKTIVIHSETLGRGDDELGKKLMGPFLRKLLLAEKKPERIIFYNSGVKLLAEGSPVLFELDELAKAGIDLAGCGTCIAYYKLDDKIAVGRKSNMQEIVGYLTQADGVITV